MSDLVERLLDADWNSHQRFLGSRICGEAADRISQQDAELERMRREVEEARQVADDRLSDNARLTNEKADALFALAEARKAAFVEAGDHVAKVMGDRYEILANTIRHMGDKAEETRP